MYLLPTANQASSLVEGPRRMFVPTVIQVAQIVCQTAEKPQLFDAEVGAGKGLAPAFGIGRLDQPLQYVQCRRLDPVAEQELLTARKPLHGRDQPQEKTQVRLQRRTGVARTVAAANR